MHGHYEVRMQNAWAPMHKLVLLQVEGLSALPSLSSKPTSKIRAGLVVGSDACGMEKTTTVNHVSSDVSIAQPRLIQ
jgi:hypothetical protein